MNESTAKQRTTPIFFNVIICLLLFSMNVEIKRGTENHAPFLVDLTPEQAGQKTLGVRAQSDENRKA
jgi:hypothetical protein